MQCQRNYLLGTGLENILWSSERFIYLVVLIILLIYTLFCAYFFANVVTNNLGQNVFDLYFGCSVL